MEAEFAEGDVDAADFLLAGVLYSFGEGFEDFVKLSALAPFLLLLLEFFFITIAMFSLAIAGLVELHISSFAIELNVFGLLLSNHDWVFEVNVDDDN